MKKVFTIFFIVLSLKYTILIAQGPSFQWAKEIGNGNYDIGHSVAVDISGNVYTTGLFTGPVDFDPGPGTYILGSSNPSDIFISKLTASGSFVWAKSMTGTGYSCGNSICVDGTGNVYTTGYFSGTADFDPGPGVYNLLTGGNFISKLDAAGNFVWAKQFGPGSGNSITVDAIGNVYTTGWFALTNDFDPGVGTYNLTSVGGQDIFISKLNSSGAFVWAKQFGDTLTDNGNSIALDPSGNVYTTGFFSDTVDFDPGPLVSNLISNLGAVFVSKLDNNGNMIWVKQLAGYADVGNCITVDPAGCVLTAGHFSYTRDFDPGPSTYTLVSAGPSKNAFISKLNSAGGFIWAKSIEVPSSDGIITGLAVDGIGNVFATGYFGGVGDFDPGIGAFNLWAGGSADIFILNLDATGNFGWAKNVGGSSIDWAYGLAVDANAVYTTGFFDGTADFDPGIGVYNLTSLGSYDIFILKLVNMATELTQIKNPIQSLNAYPNPSAGEIKIDLNHIISGQFILLNSLGEKVYAQEVTEGINLIVPKKINPGIYYYLIEDNKLPIAKGKLVFE